MPCGLEPLHPILALASGPMRILTAVVEITTLAVFHLGPDLSLRCPVALQLLRDEHPWHVLEPFEQLAEKLLRRLLVASVAPQLTVVPAPPLQEAFESMRRTPSFLWWCPPRGWHM